MPAKGFYSAQDGHWVPLIAPVDITGGKTSPAFAMKNYAHASIIIPIGVSATAFTKIILNCCSDAAGNNPNAIPFDIFKCETQDSDVLGARTAVTAAGYTPSATDRIFYVIELDAAALPQTSPLGGAYVQLQLTNGSNSVIAAAFVLLSGSRYGNDQSPTVLA